MSDFEGYDDGGGDDYDDDGDEYGDDYDDEEDYEKDDEVEESYENNEEENEYDEEQSNDFDKNKYLNEEKNILGKKIKRNIKSTEELKILKDNKENEEVYEESEEEDYYDNEEEDEGEKEDSEEKDKEQENYEFNCETGDIGEKLVYEDLKKKGNKNINWMNKKGESFEPYDFCYKKRKKIIYIDAKSTVYEKGEDPFPIITSNEQDFIDNLKKNEKYIIARVFDARGENPKIVYYDAKTMKKLKL